MERDMMTNPDFDQLLAVLNRRKPDRPVLFEFFMNVPLYERLSGQTFAADAQEHATCHLMNPAVISAFHRAGYDYVSTRGHGWLFQSAEQESKDSRSLNEGFVITDRESFDRYEWPDPDQFDYSALDAGAELLPEGMKFIVFGPGGVLENVIQLVGYENLCLMLLDDRRLAGDVFDQVGRRLVRHYEIACRYDSVGACISNDDWGFKTQTMLGPADMREFVIPWHKKIVDAIHGGNRPAILHSCGMLEEVMDDIIDVIGYDAKHSYEDTICPVERMYDKYADRIAILGGIDLDFVCRSTPEQVYERSRAMLEKAAREKGAYGLGTGNSVPEYTPDENYFAMVNAARDMRGLEPLS